VDTAETSAVPVEAFQVDQVGREFAVASLLHADDAVDALHQAASTPATTQHAADGRHGLPEFLISMIADAR
jgi:hypothetical protein